MRVIEGNRDLLRECASGPSNYYEVADASQLDEVFKSIARKINGIRLTRPSGILLAQKAAQLSANPGVKDALAEARRRIQPIPDSALPKPR